MSDILNHLKMTNDKKTLTNDSSLLGIFKRMLGPGQQPLAKIALMNSAIILSWFIFAQLDRIGRGHIVFINNFLFEGFLTICLGFRLTLYRVQSINDSNTTTSPTFKKWSRAQINNAEWAGTILVLMLALHLLACASASEDNCYVDTVAAVGAILTNIGTILYFLGVVVFHGDVKMDNPAFGDRIPPVRMAGVTCRYVGLFMMLWGVKTYVL